MKFSDEITEVFDEAQSASNGLDWEREGLSTCTLSHGNIELLREWKDNTPPTVMRAYKRQQNKRAYTRGYYAAYRKTAAYKQYRAEYLERNGDEIRRKARERYHAKKKAT